MCIGGTPKVGAVSTPAPTDVTATNLQLGSAALINRSGGIFGRLALTGGTRAARNPTLDAGSQGTPGGTSTGSTPGGTMGLPSNYLGTGVYGGLKPKVGG